MLEPWVTWSASLPPFVRFICGQMWCHRVLPASLPAPLSATLSPARWVYLCKCGAAVSASARTACAICPTLRQSQSRHSHASPLHPGARLRPSYQSGRMFIFYFFGVGPPCCSILCQFWLCEEAQCVYLRRHLGSPIHFIFVTLFALPPYALSLGNHKLVCHVYETISVLYCMFVLLFRLQIKVKSRDICPSLSDLLHLA